MRRTPLPTQLDDAFTVGDAERAGVTSARLFAHDLVAPFHGIRATVDAPRESLLDRCRTYAPRLRPFQFFSHTTAAVLWGLPLPVVDHRQLHVSAPAPGREPRTAGVRGHRLVMDGVDLTLRHDLPVPAADETWAQLGSLIPRDALVAAADAILTAGLADRDDLAAALGRLRRHGAADLEYALARARPGAESPRETTVRLLLLDAGLPEPELNWTLRSDGRFVARLDLAYPDYRVAIEYDGRQHASMEQFRRDADRWPAIAREGWILIRVLGHHLRDPDANVIMPVKVALRSRGWYPSASA